MMKIERHLICERCFYIHALTDILDFEDLTPERFYMRDEDFNPVIGDPVICIKCGGDLVLMHPNEVWDRKFGRTPS